MLNDSLGDRMKEDYENKTRYELPRRTYTLIRVDGKAFHSFTRGCKRPFDDRLIQAMDNTAQDMCKEMAGCRLAFVQSDEISLLLTDFESNQTQAWFGGNLQKIVSISAAMATAYFNEHYNSDTPADQRKSALFDARAYTVSLPWEVENYLIWRQQDASRNSVNMVAQSLYSHRELEGVKLDQAQELIFQKGINWNDFPAGKKRGRLVVKKQYEVPRATKEDFEQQDGPCIRSRWEVVDPPIFTQDRSVLRGLIPSAALS